ncbi:MAG: hypothetical protein GY797_31525 [Deltaproteobacteria bacterium]|nr:hypothetical protein [Deltaproteobacteria bacterium]
MSDNEVISIKPLQIERIEEQLQEIREKVSDKLLPMEEYSKIALAFLEHDISNSALEVISQQNHDIFVLRANQIGLVLSNNRAYHYAAAVYEALLTKAENYIQKSGKERHLGVLKVNLGSVYIMAGNFDAGVSLLLETATRDDVSTYGIDPSGSYALTHLRKLVLSQMFLYIIGLCDSQFRVATSFPLNQEAISTVVNHTNPLGDITLMSLIPLIRHCEWQKRASTQYGRVRIMDGLRWLSAMLENMTIFIGTNSLNSDTQGRFNNANRLTLWDAYGRLFSGEEWWASAQQSIAVTSVERSDSEQDILQKYQQLFSMTEGIREELLSKIVLLSRLTRNFSMHYLEIPALVLDQIIEDIIRYQLLAQILIFDWAYHKGHFTHLSSPGVWPQ